MGNKTTCLKCGAPLTGDARGGFCPKCLFAQASAGDSDDGPRSSQLAPSHTAAAEGSASSDHVPASAATGLPLPRCADLDEATAAYVPMRKRFVELLRAREEAAGFLQDSAPGAQRPADALTSPNTLQNAAAPGEKVGNESPSRPIRYFGDYELLEEIARGGMGIVFKARQRKLDRLVAVKMILAGEFASREQALRFRAEVEAAARLQHPNIVRIHETGEQEGQPYFSMDYVEGGNLAALVREKPLPAKRAAGYVKTIAEAIYYAHEQGILHRDLKPSNVLIDSNDQPRVTDFGLAKQMQKESFLTMTGDVMGSPNFMPPEQAGARSVKTGRYSDVYSLGGILFYLVTGRPPFIAGSVAETLHHVLNTEPISPRLLNPSVPQDIATICLKCLEKESAKRYPTAQELAEELNRFLNEKPIRARPVSRAERAWRWCRRKPVVASLSAVTLFLVLAVAIGSPVAAFRINRERQRARTAEQTQSRLRQQAEADEKNAKAEAAKSQQVAQFLKDMLKGVGPGVALGRDTAMLREILDRTAERVGHGLAGQAEVEAELRNTIGSIYLELGEPAKAESMHRTALRLRQDVFGQEHLAVAESLDGLGRSLWRLGKAAEAEPLVQEALKIRRKIYGDAHPDVATSLNNLGTLFYVQGKLNEAEPLFRDALRMRKKSLPDFDPEVAKSLHNLGTLLRDQGKLSQGEELLREALALQRKHLGVAHPDLAMTEYNLGLLLMKQSRQAEAEPLLREAAAMGKKLLGDAHPDLAHALATAGATLLEQGKPTEAEPLLRQALAMQKKLLPAGHPDLLRSLHLLGTALTNQGRASEAELLFRADQTSQRKLSDNEDSIKEAK